MFICCALCVFVADDIEFSVVRFYFRLTQLETVSQFVHAWHKKTLHQRIIPLNKRFSFQCNVPRYRLPNFVQLFQTIRNDKIICRLYVKLH